LLNKWLVAIIFSGLLLVPVVSQNVFALQCIQTPNCTTGNLYVVDRILDSVRQYDGAGNLINADFITDAPDPRKITHDFFGRIYVFSNDADRVRQYDGAGNLINFRFVDDTNLVFVRDLEFDFAGNLYIIEGADVQLYCGGVLCSFAALSFIDDADSPFFIAFDPDGNLYLVDGGLDSVRQYDSAGNLINADFITDLTFPSGIAFDSAGNLYVVDSNSVRQYDSTGNLINADFITGLFQPEFIAIDSDGNLYVANSNSVRQYDSTGNLINADFITGLIDIQDIAFDFTIITVTCGLDTILAGDECISELVRPLTCGAGTILQDNECVADLASVCGDGTKIENMMCVVSIVVGGAFIHVDKSGLFLAAAQLTASWIIPVVVSGIGIGLFILRRK